MQDPYVIRAVAKADLPLISRWRAMPQVSRWWGDPASEPEDEKLDDPRIAMWIAQFGQQPFAFIQDYAVHDWPRHPFAYLPRGSRGMDLFIGEPAMIGAGHGSRLVRQHVDRLFALGAPAFGIDPHPDNAPAIRAFEKAGFRFVRGPLETQWGRAILMDRFAG